MFVLITGASASGKSEFAESVCVNLAKNEQKLYIATMQPFGEDAQFRIKRHKQLRVSKGFATLERYTDLGDCLQKDYNTILLECMSNLLANEMFSNEKTSPVLGIMSGINYLKNHCENLVVVTNQIFSEEKQYDEQTTQYIKTLGWLNIELAQNADVLYEVVCGIPIKIKGESL